MGRLRGYGRLQRQSRANSIPGEPRGTRRAPLPRAPNLNSDKGHYHSLRLAGRAMERGEPRRGTHREGEAHGRALSLSSCGYGVARSWRATPRRSAAESSAPGNEGFRTARSRRRRVSPRGCGRVAGTRADGADRAHRPAGRATRGRLAGGWRGVTAGSIRHRAAGGDPHRLSIQEDPRRTERRLAGRASAHPPG